MVAAQPIGFATAKDLLLLPDDARAEVIEGQIVYKVTSGEHGNAQGGIIEQLRPSFHRKAGGSRPGGWWILPEVEIQLSLTEVYRPDVAGWKRERVPQCPHGRPQTVVPDWVCEVLSPSNASNDLVKKLRIYHRCDIKHYWV